MRRKLDATHLEQLVTFLSVARLGTLSAAAKHLGLSHTTVSRRLADLERAMGHRLMTKTSKGWMLTELGTQLLPVAEGLERAMFSMDALSRGSEDSQLQGVVTIAAPDAFTRYKAIPALVALRRREPALHIEITTATQQVRQRASGVDIEVVIGKPRVHHGVAREALSYALKLYASRQYIKHHGMPESLEGLREHSLNYYIESALQVDELDEAVRKLPDMPLGISSTSVFAHLGVTLEGGGIGLLPDYVAKGTDLLPVLPEEFEHTATYWIVTRRESARNPNVRACVEAMCNA